MQGFSGEHKGFASEIFFPSNFYFFHHCVPLGAPYFCQICVLNSLGLKKKSEKNYIDTDTGLLAEMYICLLWHHLLSEQLPDTQLMSIGRELGPF